MSQSTKKSQKQLADILFPVRSAGKDDDEGILNVPLNERKLHTETYDFTISTLVGLLQDNKIVVPEFQRKYVWTRVQASRLIESLIIQCPIPVIYLDQEDDGTLKVIDGNQRLMSILLFCQNEFKLKGMKAFPDLNTLSFRQLDPRFQSHIENRTLRCITILKDTHPQIKFDVFERLNTGSVQLNPQELRHGLYYGKLMEDLDKLGEDENWKALSGFKDDKRMRGAELILRFLALSSNLVNYEKPMAGFLNDFARTNKDADAVEKFEKVFGTTVAAIRKIFGSRAFRMLDTNGKPSTNFNSAIFDAQMVGFAQSGKSAENLSNETMEGIFSDYLKLQETADFKRSISASTSDAPLVRIRVNKFKELIEARIQA